MNNADNAAFVVNGDMKHAKALGARISACSPVIAVDGGLNHCDRLGIVPDLIIGDFDSVDPRILHSPKYGHVRKIQLERAKDLTDLESAVARLAPEVGRMTLFGGWGKRLDHSIVNLLMLLRYPGRLFLDTGEERVLASDTGTLPFYGISHCLIAEKLSSRGSSQVADTVQLLSEMPPWPFRFRKTQETMFIVNQDAGRVEVSSTPGQVVSLLPVRGAVSGVETSGLQWELKDRTLDKHFLSVSNLSTDVAFTLQVKEGELLCILNHDLIDLGMLS